MTSKSQRVDNVLKNTKHPAHMREMCAMFVHNIPVTVETPYDGCVFNQVAYGYAFKILYKPDYYDFGCERFIFRSCTESPKFVMVEAWTSTLCANLPLPDCILAIIYNFARLHHLKHKF